MRSVLRRGSSGPDVVRLQELLNKHLRPSPQLKVDGIFGPPTEGFTLRSNQLPGFAPTASWGHSRGPREE